MAQCMPNQNFFDVTLSTPSHGSAGGLTANLLSILSIERLLHT